MAQSRRGGARRVFQGTKQPTFWLRRSFGLVAITGAAVNASTLLTQVQDFTFQGAGTVLGVDWRWTLRRLIAQVAGTIVTVVAKQIVRIIWGIVVKDQGVGVDGTLTSAASQREDWLGYRALTVVGTAAASPQAWGEANNLVQGALDLDVRSQRSLEGEDTIQFSLAMAAVPGGPALDAGTTVQGNVTVSSLWSRTRKV